MSSSKGLERLGLDQRDVAATEVAVTDNALAGHIDALHRLRQLLVLGGDSDCLDLSRHDGPEYPASRHAHPRRGGRALFARPAPGALAGDARDGGARRARRRTDRALGDRPVPGRAVPRARPGRPRGGHGDRLLDAAHGRAARARTRGHAGARSRARRAGPRRTSSAAAWPTAWRSSRATRSRRCRASRAHSTCSSSTPSKGEYARYIELAESKLSERALMVVDNLLMSGEVALPEGAETPVERRLARVRTPTQQRSCSARSAGSPACCRWATESASPPGARALSRSPAGCARRRDR